MFPAPPAECLANARRALLAERNTAGHWEGELSTSALSTATAIVALSAVDAERHAKSIENGLRWLIENQNADGGWGDTVRSHSNLSTTLLCWSALTLAPETERANAESRAESWIAARVGSLEIDALVEAVKARYGKDRTFSVPILMLCAIRGRLGDPREAWRRVLPLPFELSAVPRRWFAALQLPVVSYALPALIAIGYARFFHAPPPWPLSWIRRRAWAKASRLLTEIQPSSGGFLEATPLTSFVTMALAAADRREHPVIEKAVAFLIESVRPDGSWPIDTNLATWVTTLAVKALGPNRVESPTQQGTVADPTLLDRKRVRDWLLGQQYRDIHPYTDAPPGGWAWTDLPGGVPDADDTPGALLALKLLADGDSEADCRAAAERGIVWLLNLQNRDGGLPTFCRGWGALPFDRSSPDLTAHTLRAWAAWDKEMPAALRWRIDRATRRALTYLWKNQHADGSWTPLWFGNQDLVTETNPTYGTALVLRALRGLEPRLDAAERARAARGESWLLANQNGDGGWGGGGGTRSSLEETALAVAALAEPGRNASEATEAVSRGERWLAAATKNGTEFPAAPIGFYFAKLWYFERLYPMIWATEAWERVAARNEAG